MSLSKSVKPILIGCSVLICEEIYSRKIGALALFEWFDWKWKDLYGENFCESDYIRDKNKLLNFLLYEYGINFFYNDLSSLEKIRKYVIRNFGMIILRKLFTSAKENKKPTINLEKIKGHNKEILNVQPIIGFKFLVTRFNSPLYNH